MHVVARWILTRKGTQMINSDLIQTLVTDRPHLRMNNREKNFFKKLSAEIYFSDLQKLQKPRFLNVFEIFLSKTGLWSKVAYANWKI